MNPAFGTGRYRPMFLALLIFSLGWVALGFLLDSPKDILHGMRVILFSNTPLITDYFEVAGPGAAFVNAGLVCLLSVLLLDLAGDLVNGYTFMTMGLMAGFSLFGKNLLNIMPILLGTYLYARFKKEPFAKYAPVGLLSTALGPMVSYLAFGRDELWAVGLAVLMGLVIGFAMPPLAAHTFHVLNGMNLYNAGFACGILGMVLVPVLSAVSLEPQTVLFWSTGHNQHYGLAIGVICMGLIGVGLVRGRASALLCYTQMLHTSGRAPSDYLRAFGAPAVSINMGVNGLLGMTYILAVGGDLNGPTIGGILTIMGFSAYGKHAANIAPVMLGVFIGNFVNHVPMNNPTMQLAGLFGTTLAPISGVFGWPFGVLAGLLHSSVVLQCGAAVNGMNLYNNGFSGGLVALVLYPLLSSVVHRRRPHLRDLEFFEQVEHDEPISPAKLDAQQEEEE